MGGEGRGRVNLANVRWNKHHNHGRLLLAPAQREVVRPRVAPARCRIPSKQGQDLGADYTRGYTHMWGLDRGVEETSLTSHSSRKRFCFFSLHSASNPMRTKCKLHCSTWFDFYVAFLTVQCRHVGMT